MGGGGSKATTTTDIATKSIVEALARSIMNCSSNTQVNQTFKIQGSYNVVKNVKQVQYLKLSSTCSNEAKNLNDIQQTVSNAIAQTAESQSVSVLGALGSSRSETNAKILNEVQQKITNETITNIVNEVNALQEITIEGDNNIVDKLDQEQTMSFVMDSCQKVLNTLTSVQEIQNKVKQDSSAKQTNFISDIISTIIDGLAKYQMIYGVILLVAFALFIWLIKVVFQGMFGSNDNGAFQQIAPYAQQYMDQQQYQQQQYQQQY